MGDTNEKEEYPHVNHYQAQGIHQPQGLQAVSYTHLDVYKRQEPQEPVPTEEGKGTQEEPFTTVAAYNEAVKGDALDGKDVYLTISRTEFKEGRCV